MENYFYRLGTVEECTERRNRLNASSSVGTGEAVIFNDSIEFEGDVYVHLLSVCEKFDLEWKELFTDAFLEVLNCIAARTGVFPIKKIERNSA